MLKIYCIDIGNTRTHCATVAFDGSIFKVEASADYMSNEFAKEFVEKSLFSKSGASAVSWCSVVPKYSELLKSVLVGIDSMQLTCENSPLVLDIISPTQLGQDRIADAVGAGVFLEPPYIVVDMGTAVTIDLVDGQGRYAGGAIAPGMNAFASYLSERAAQLPEINPAEADCSLVVGKDTKQAMYVGCAKGFCKLIDGLIDDIANTYFAGISPNNKTIFTGGSVSLLPKGWLGNRKVNLNLAHIGLAKAFVYNRKIV
ncbi:MAG: type III pantothenate kinase [Verrucomicrobiaceae bacterium]|nr:type III pantothenate kinase [Verrucomicrobiaceae bacterium]